MTEQQPHFDGEYYHLAWWHNEISDKFKGSQVILYNVDIDYQVYKNQLFTKEFKRWTGQGFMSSDYKYYSYIAIKKEDYER